jgi:hypothetical protein
MTARGASAATEGTSRGRMLLSMTKQSGSFACRAASASGVNSMLYKLDLEKPLMRSEKKRPSSCGFASLQNRKKKRKHREEDQPERVRQRRTGDKAGTSFMCERTHSSTGVARPTTTSATGRRCLWMCEPGCVCVCVCVCVRVCACVCEHKATRCCGCEP